jgi:1,4-alpha-glucan branching enzyme
LSSKEYYDPDKAARKTDEHAGNFLFNRQAQVRYLKDKTKNPPKEGFKLSLFFWR